MSKQSEVAKAAIKANKARNAEDTTAPVYTGDTIVYTTSRNGTLRSAAFTRDGVSPDYEIGEFGADVVNIEDARAGALAKLNPLDRLVLGL